MDFEDIKVGQKLYWGTSSTKYEVLSKDSEGFTITVGGRYLAGSSYPFTLAEEAPKMIMIQKSDLKVGTRYQDQTRTLTVKYISDTGCLFDVEPETTTSGKREAFIHYSDVEPWTRMKKLVRKIKKYHLWFKANNNEYLLTTWCDEESATRRVSACGYIGPVFEREYDHPEDI